MNTIIFLNNQQIFNIKELTQSDLSCIFTVKTYFIVTYSSKVLY